MARALGRLVGRLVKFVRRVSWSDVLVVGGSVKFVRRVSWSDVLVVGGSVSLYYGLWLVNPAVGYVVIGIIWMVIGLVAAWRKGGG